MDITSSKQKKQNRRVSVLESLKELGQGASKDFASQIFGGSFMPEPQHYSGEILPDQQVDINQVLNGNQEKEEKLHKQLDLERNLRQEEKALFDKKNRELQLALKAVTDELQQIAKSTPKLADQIQIAVMQAPVNPGVYHVFFFERLLEYLKGFRHRIDEANIWLMAVNKRANKKTFWGQYQKHGGRRLLSAEDYLQRSAG